MWRPFKICSRKWLKNWNIRNSLIGLFATFLLLSYVKILAVSTEILFLSLGNTEVYSYKINGTTASWHTIYNANIGAKHLPFVLLALVISFSFVLLPFLLLLVYPCGCFHRLCLNRCGGRCRTLHVYNGRLPRQLQDTATRHEVLCCLLLILTSTDTGTVADLSLVSNALFLRNFVLHNSYCGGRISAV